MLWLFIEHQDNPLWAGRIGLVVWALGPGGRVSGIEYRPGRSAFFWCLFLLLLSFLIMSHLSQSAVSLSNYAWCHMLGLRVWFAMGKQKRDESKNPSSTICEANTDITAMFGKGGGRKIRRSLSSYKRRASIFLLFFISGGSREPNIINPVINFINRPLVTFLHLPTLWGQKAFRSWWNP